MSDIKPPKALVFTNGDASHAWKMWLQQFEWYEVATELSEKTPQVQCATFMVSLGPDVITIFNNFQLTDEEKIDLKILKKKFADYFNPKKNITFERYTFNNMRQEDGELFEEFYLKITKQSKNCEFGNLNDDLLRDKIVIGVKDSNLRTKLLIEQNLDLEKTVMLYRAGEQAQKQVEVINSQTDIPVNVIHKNENTKSECSRCGNNHLKNKCPAVNEICNKCFIKGHYSKMCNCAILLRRKFS